MFLLLSFEWSRSSIVFFMKLSWRYRVDNMLLWFYPCQCSLYRILCPVASVTTACDFCENCDFCDFKCRTFSSFRSMRTLFLATYFSVLFMLNSLNFTWLCVFGQPSFHGIYRYSKDLRLLHSILFRKVRGQHSKEQSEVLAYIPAFVCSLSCRVPEIARGNLGCLTNSIRSSPSSRAVLLLANELLVYVVWVVVSSFPTPCPLLF